MDNPRVACTGIPFNHFFFLIRGATNNISLINVLRYPYNSTLPIKSISYTNVLEDDSVDTITFDATGVLIKLKPFQFITLKAQL